MKCEHIKELLLTDYLDDQVTESQKQKIEWGSQIRSYVLHPYLLVKDHRTNLEIHNAKAVLEGSIDEFMYAYLKKQASMR